MYNAVEIQEDLATKDLVAWCASDLRFLSNIPNFEMVSFLISLACNTGDDILDRSNRS